MPRTWPPLLLCLLIPAGLAFGQPVEDTEEYRNTQVPGFLFSNEDHLGRLARNVARRSGGAYLGVGPEQNYTLMAFAQAPAPALYSRVDTVGEDLQQQPRLGRVVVRVGADTVVFFHFPILFVHR